MTIILSSHPILQLAGERMINCVLEGIGIALLASVLLCLTTCRNSSTRFLVWFSALLTIAGLSLAACTGSAGASGGTAAAKFTLPASWMAYALAAWGVIACLGIVRVVWGLWRVRSLRAQSAPLVDVDPELARQLSDCNSGRRVRLYVSDELRVPTAIGYFKPGVLIPRWAITDLSSAELNAIVLHELGHLRRWDDWTNLAQKVLRAVLFFHPAVWWLDARLSLEREIACDDLVLAKTSDARGYAECLVSIAEKSVLRTRLALAVAAVGRVGQTTLRLTRILDQHRLPETRASRMAVAIAGSVGVAALAVLPHVPAMVVFQENSQPNVSAISARESGGHNEMGASYIPVRMTQSTNDQRQSFALPAVIKTPIASSRPLPRSKATVLRTAHKRSAATAPWMVRTGVKNGNQTVAPTLLLVVQTAQYGPMGASEWNITVWHFAVLPQKAVANPSVSKSI
jgi:beta-lactamase regulating signal transducer with metallopeptidase domain